MSDKRRTTVYIDEGLFDQAKTRGDNLSEVLNEALAENTEEMASCHYCNMFYDEAMAKENLIWLCPDEQWCCNKCMKEKVDEVVRNHIVAKL